MISELSMKPRKDWLRRNTLRNARHLNKTGRGLLIRFLLPLLLVGIWQAAAIALNKPVILPRIETVMDVLIHPTAKTLVAGSLLLNTVISVVRVLMGFLIAASLAVPLGIWMGHSAMADSFFDSAIELIRPIPPLAWMPLILAWLGIRGLSDWMPQLLGNAVLSHIQFGNLTIITIGAFFPMLLSTVQGVKGIPPEYIESARTLGAKRASLLFKVLIPASLPSILTGLRIGMGVGWMCLVGAEMMPGSSAGLGYLIWYAYELLHTEIIVAGMLIVGVIGFSMDRGFKMLESGLARR